MISFCRAYTVNGKTFASLEEAQRAEIEDIFRSESDSRWTVVEIGHRIMDNADKIIDVLTTTESSRPKARKINGASKKKRTKNEAETQEPSPASEAQFHIRQVESA